MNTSDYTNQLKALMDFYSQSGMGGNASMGTPDDYGGGAFTYKMNQANAAGDRLRFAQSVMDRMNDMPGGMPNYQAPPNFFNFGPAQAQAGSVGNFAGMPQLAQYDPSQRAYQGVSQIDPNQRAYQGTVALNDKRAYQGPVNALARMVRG